MNATQQFAATIEECRTLAAQINQMIEDHLDVDPEKCHWGNVGDVTRLKLELLEITKWLNP